MLVRKRKRGDRLFGLQIFGDPGCPADYYGAFRDNILDFLQDFAEREDYNLQGMPLWSIPLLADNSFNNADNTNIVTLFVVQEPVDTATHPHCDHCRCIGWSHHLVSKHRYHFIIPATEMTEHGAESLSMKAKMVCPNCRVKLPTGLPTCQTCLAEGVQASVLDMPSHLLHGVLHTNGFGHLLTLNGRQRGSAYVLGRDLMDLWDRLCSMLRARKVSLEDVARKRGMELRLLNAVAYGDSWFGRWGYRFGHGSYGVTQQMHVKAIEVLRSMPLAVMNQHFEDHAAEQKIPAIVAPYQRLSTQPLYTVGDLVRFMLELKARLPTQNQSIPESTSSSVESNKTARPMEIPCRWSVKRLELAAQVIVEALRNGDSKWMPRQNVRDAARAYIGDTGLLDYVLKSLGNRIVGGYVVRRAVNPVTKVLEYSLEDAGSDDDTATGITSGQVVRDVGYFYKNVLEMYEPAVRRKEMLAGIQTAARIILDTKQLIKDYRGETTRAAAVASSKEMGLADEDEMLRVLCLVELPEGFLPPPPDLVVVPPHSTLGELKQHAERALRDTHYALDDFCVESIVGIPGEDDELLFGALESGATVVVSGSGVDVSCDLVYEGGTDSWTVDCPCGTQDDDGERMIECDMCEVWQHTRCGGIADSDDIPDLFLCNRCRVGLLAHAV